MDNEIYNLVIGFRLPNKKFIGYGIFDTEGYPATVGFNPRDVFKYEDSLWPGTNVIGFYHTHPNMPNYPSQLDYDTMGAWVNCLGRPLLCAIEGNNGLAMHWFIDDTTRHITLNGSKKAKLFVGDCA